MQDKLSWSRDTGIPRNQLWLLTQKNLLTFECYSVLIFKLNSSYLVLGLGNAYKDMWKIFFTFNFELLLDAWLRKMIVHWTLERR